MMCACGKKATKTLFEMFWCTGADGEAEKDFEEIGYCEECYNKKIKEEKLK